MDTWQNNGDGDPGFDHLAFQINGDTDHDGSNNLVGPITLSNIEDGDDKCFRIEWNPGTFELSGNLDGTPIRYVGDIVNDIFGGNPNVHWGFTASTGGSNNEQRVCINGSTTTAVAMQDSIICLGDTIELNASPNGMVYTWELADSLSCLLYTSPSPRDATLSRMPSSA